MTQPEDATPEPRKWIIRILGSLQVQKPTVEITEFPGTKSGALLGFLAYNLGKTYSREMLAEMFWPDGDSINQRTRLRQELSALRALFNAGSPSTDGVLITTPKTVQLNAHYVVTDVQQFLDSLERASVADPGERERRIEQAISLYRGDLLKDYPDNFILERSLLSHRYEQAMRGLATLLREKQDLPGAEKCLKQLLHYNPLEEEVHVDLMRLYAAAGQPASIRRQYQILEQALQEQLGAAPLIETQQVTQELLQRSRPSENMPAARTSTPTSESVDWSDAATDAPLDQDAPKVLPGSPTLPRRSLRLAFSRRNQRILIAACLALVGIPGYFVRRALMPAPTATASLPLLRYQESANYLYEPRVGQKDNAEAKAIISDRHNNVYAAGQIETTKDDTDILVFKLTPELKYLWAQHYSSREHDCDRANSLALGKDGGLYVAGETYVPAGNRDQEGWHTVLVKFDSETGRIVWDKRTPNLCHNDQLHIQVLAYPQGGVVVGCTLTDKGRDQLQLIRYDADGRCVWNQKYPLDQAPGSSFCDMTMDEVGNVYVCGVARWGQGPNGEHNSGLVACYDPTGQSVWHDYVDGPVLANAGAYQIRVVAERVLAGGVVSTGDPGQGGHGDCLALANYTRSGKRLWERHDPASGPTVKFAAATFEPTTSTYLIAGTRSLANANCAAVFAKYDLAGNQIFHKQYAPAPGYASSAAKLITAGFLLAGMTSPHNEFYTIHQDSEMFVARLTSDGDLQAQYGYKLDSGRTTPEAGIMLPGARAVYAGQAATASDGYRFFVSSYDFTPGGKPGL